MKPLHTTSAADGTLPRGAVLLAAAAPVFLIMQPFLPGLLQSMVLWIHLLLAPALVMLLRPAIIPWPPLLALAALVVATSASALSSRPDDFMLLALPLAASLIAFRFGAYLARQPGLERMWSGLVMGVTALNLITFAYLGLVSIGVVDISALYEVIQRDEVFQLDRFALGNPIMTPFMMTALLYTAIRLGRPTTLHLPAVSINFAAAAMSQSRVVVLIATLLVLRQWWKARLPIRTLFAATVGVTVASQWELIEPLLESLFTRFEGNDFGSAQDREKIVYLALNSIDLSTAFLGSGLTGGAQLMRNTMGEYRSVESLALQWLVELGVVGILLIVLCMLPRVSLSQQSVALPSPIVLLLWVQALLFLPAHGAMASAFFALGALSHASPRVRPMPKVKVTAVAPVQPLNPLSA